MNWQSVKRGSKNEDIRQKTLGIEWDYLCRTEEQIV